MHEPALEASESVTVFDYEKASEVIGTAQSIGVSLCYFRHKMAHVGRDCSAPKENCLTFGKDRKYGEEGKEDSRNGQILELERELSRVRQDYMGTLEELQAANEEMHSSNEELIEIVVDIKENQC